MNPIHIAIVIPVYNASKYISDCLDSIVAQTYQNWEAICVDDGSTDDSLHILKDYAKKDQRIKVYTKENGGASSARNFALSQVGASSDTWISFVDSDDYIRPTMYSNIIDSLISSNDTTIDYVRLKSERTSLRPNQYIAPLSKRLDFQIFDKEGYFNNGSVGGMIASLFVKSTVIKNNNLTLPTEMRILEDQVLSLRCAMLSEKIMIINQPDYLYYINPNSLTESSNNNSNDIIRCINYAYEILCNKGYPEIDKYFHKRYMPVKISLLLDEIMRYGCSTKEQINCDLKPWTYIKGIKSHIKFFILKLRALI